MKVHKALTTLYDIQIYTCRKTQEPSLFSFPLEIPKNAGNCPPITHSISDSDEKSISDKSILGLVAIFIKKKEENMARRMKWVYGICAANRMEVGDVLGMVVESTRV